MGVEIHQQTRYRFFHETVEVDLVDIFVADDIQDGLEFFLGGRGAVFAVDEITGEKTEDKR